MMLDSTDTTVAKDRLTRNQWIAHGLRTLASHGEGALKTATLAARLNVTRGSFYWHFKSITDFRQQLLDVWMERATDDVIREIDQSIVGAARLNYLMKRAFYEDRSLDRAFRAWAATDPEAAKVVSTVDGRRIAYLAKLLRDSGVDERKAASRAEFVYWAYIGQSSVMNVARPAITDKVIDDLSGLLTQTDHKS